MVSRGDFAECESYIADHWKKITFSLKKDTDVHFALPNRFVSPNSDAFKDDQFYWDSYFIILGLLESGKIDLAKGMVDNFIYTYNRFKIIPPRNRYFNLGASQVPFLTSMILEVFKRTGDKRWLRKSIRVAEDELSDYWMNEKRTRKRKVKNGLSRYCDHYVIHLTAEHESGWDMTSRFDDRCLDFLPVDLNSCLYRYERDISEAYSILGDDINSNKYKRAASRRKKNMNSLMWDDRKGFFFDYDFKAGRRRTFFSLAGFCPLWAGLASPAQAKRICLNLKHLEAKGGLANTQKAGLSKVFKQWDHPNGWANQQWIAIDGLLQYDLRPDAERLATKWLNMNKRVFARTGKFWEKYNVVNADKGKEGRYPLQSGFGWTNAIFLKLLNEFYPK